jgi:capsular exopolysaccharide synthesis family protein
VSVASLNLRAGFLFCDIQISNCARYNGVVPGTGKGSAATPNFFDSVGVLWRRKLLIVLILLVAVAATAGIDKTRIKQYQSTVTLYFLAQGVNANSGASTSLDAQQLATDVELVQSAPVQAAVSKALGAPAPSVSVAQVGTTQVAGLTVKSTDPEFAARAANEYAKAYIDQTHDEFVLGQLASESSVQNQINGLQTQIDTVQSQLSQASSVAIASESSLQSQLTGLYQQQSALKTQLSQIQLVTAQSSSGGQVVSPAVASTTPSSPKISRDIGIAIVAGLLVGIGFALLRDNLDDRVRGKDGLEQLVPGIPILGLIPVIKEWHNRKRPFLVAKAHPKSPPTEAYRGLRTSVQFMALENPTKILQITSPSAGDGKTTTSANIAWIMAEAGQRVVLVSCDLRRPRIHEFFGLQNDVGFTSVLLGETALRDALIAVPDQPHLRMLPSGPVPPNPSELLSSTKAHEVFESLSAIADIVIVDSAPILPVTDAAVLSTHADAILLVVSAGTDKRRDVVRAVETLTQINAPIIGTVLNRSPEADSYSYSRYGYGYGYDDNLSDKADRAGKKAVETPNDSPISATTNGNGAMNGAHQIEMLIKHLEDIDWTYTGRHAKVGGSPTAPTLFPPQDGDFPRE